MGVVNQKLTVSLMILGSHSQYLFDTSVVIFKIWFVYCSCHKVFKILSSALIKEEIYILLKTENCVLFF